MKQRTKVARALAALGLVSAAFGGVVATSSPAGADPILPIDWNVDATTHIASVGIDSTTTGGSFVGEVDLGTGALTGDLSLPPAETSFEVLGLGLADVGFAVEPTAPTTGTVDLSTLTVTMTSTFDIKLTHVSPAGVDLINLVGDHCRTREPITLTATGPVDLVNGSTITGEFSIPRFERCGLLTFGLNLLLPGDGNTFSATASPRA
jgi:hypothetical protein